MEITWQMFLIVCPLAFLAGFVDSVAGGGGLISLPAYYLAGLPPVLAAGTNKLSACQLNFCRAIVCLFYCCEAFNCNFLRSYGQYSLFCPVVITCF